MNNNYIANLRQKKKLTQQELANMIHVSNKTLSKWESNRGLPDISLLIPLSNVLNTTPLELLKGQDIKNKDSKSINIDDLIKYNKEYKILKCQEIKKMIKIVISLIVLVWTLLFTFNFIRITKYNLDPIFLINTKEEYVKDGPSNYLIKEENGLIYKWILKGSLNDDNGDSIILNKDSNYHFTIDQKYLYIFNINIYKQINGIKEYGIFPLMPILKILPFLIIYFILCYLFIIQKNYNIYSKNLFAYLLSLLFCIFIFYVNGYYVFNQFPSTLVLFRLIIYPIILTIINDVFSSIIKKRLEK